MRFIVYDPSNGLDHYDTLGEAHEALDDTIDYYRSDAQDEGEWSQDVEGCWLAAIIAEPVAHELPRDEDADPEDLTPVDYAVGYADGRRHVLPLSDDELALLYQVVTVASVEDARRGVETPGLPVLLMRVRALAAGVTRG